MGNHDMITNTVLFKIKFVNTPLNFLFSDNIHNPSGCFSRCYNLMNSGFFTENDMLDTAGLGYNAKITYYASGF